MTRVRFAPSPTGSLHVGNALSAVANRDFGDWFLLRIDDTDRRATSQAARRRSSTTSGGSGSSGTGAGAPERAAGRVPRGGATRRARAALRADTLLRDDGTATYQLASVVDDIDFGITHVIRGSDHRRTRSSIAICTGHSGVEPPEYLHHGLIVGEDGQEALEARAGDGRVASRPGTRPRRFARYLEELGLPKHESTTTFLGSARSRSRSSRG